MKLLFILFGKHVYFKFGNVVACVLLLILRIKSWLIVWVFFYFCSLVAFLRRPSPSKMGNGDPRGRSLVCGIRAVGCVTVLISSRHFADPSSWLLRSMARMHIPGPHTNTPRSRKTKTTNKDGCRILSVGRANTITKKNLDGQTYIAVNFLKKIII